MREHQITLGEFTRLMSPISIRSEIVAGMVLDIFEAAFHERSHESTNIALQKLIDYTKSATTSYSLKDMEENIDRIEREVMRAKKEIKRLKR